MKPFSADLPVGVALFEICVCGNMELLPKDEAKTKRDKLFTCAPLQIKEHLLPYSEDGEGTALNDSCYGKCVLFREKNLHYVIC